MGDGSRTARHRSVEQLIEEQAHRWRLQRLERRPEARPPVITLSRQYGAHGEEVATRLGRELGLEVFDREIIQRIARRTHLRERAVAALDERDRAIIDEWLAPFAAERYLTQYDYFHHLVGVVAAIARRGKAVVVGRGGHLILREGEALRVMVVAPLEARLATVADEARLSPREARERLEAVEAERRAFLRLYFHADFDDRSQFDLVVNAAMLGVDGAVTAISGAYAAMAAASGVRTTPVSPAPAAAR